MSEALLWQLPSLMVLACVAWWFEGRQRANHRQHERALRRVVDDFEATCEHLVREFRGKVQESHL